MNDTKRIELGRNILDVSNYRILPVRIMKPEQFEHPLHSLEGKRKLLLSLSPMLSDNENQRKIDVTACEEYTRCKSSKGKGRFSTYDYTDFDTNAMISHSEYETRYTSNTLCITILFITLFYYVNLDILILFKPINQNHMI